MKLTSYRVYAVALTIFCALVYGAVLSAQGKTAEGQGMISLRDDINGYLCYDFQEWGNCFAYTLTPNNNSPTVTPTLIAASATVPATPSATHTALPPSATPLPPSATPVSATPTRIPPSPTVMVVVSNAGFEDGLTGWTQFPNPSAAQIRSERISTGADGLAVHSGDASAKLSTERTCFQSGVYQTIAVPVGRNVNVTAWFLTMGSEHFDLHHAELGMNSEVGILLDRYGLIDPASSDVVFKYANGSDVFPNIGGGNDPTWTTVSLTTRTLSDRLTVFMSADLGKARTGNCMWRFQNLLAFIDDVTVEVVP